MENGKSRLQQSQEEVEEVTIIMRDNIEKAEEREHKLDDLEVRASMLLQKSGAFEKKTYQVKQKMKKGNKKMKIVFIAIGVVVLVIIVGLIIYFCA